MAKTRSSRAWTLIGAAVLALTVLALARRPVQVSASAPEELRDAVAAPISPVLLGGARVVSPNAGYFASPAGRRAEAEGALLSSRRTKVSKFAAARAAKLRRAAARERVRAVSAQ